MWLVTVSADGVERSEVYNCEKAVDETLYEVMEPSKDWCDISIVRLQHLFEVKDKDMNLRELIYDCDDPTVQELLRDVLTLESYMDITESKVVRVLKESK